MEHLTCTACELHKGRIRVVVGYGNPHAQIACIGEAPGREEDESGIPFVGMAGRFLNECLKEAGIESDDIFLSNIVSCRPKDNNLRAHPNAVLTCPPLWLTDELKDIPVIVALGGTSGNYWLPGKAVSELETLCRVLPSGQIVVGSMHPAARGDKEEKRRSIVRSLRRAKGYVRE